jgi:protein involved in polysaccharide export with SLBB domain
MKPLHYLTTLLIACLPVSAATTEARSPAPNHQRSVRVLGAVNHPGDIAMPPAGERFTLREAIAAAGGPTRLAELRAVRITRKVTLEIDVQQMTKSRNPSTYLNLQEGDTIHVPLRP